MIAGLKAGAQYFALVFAAGLLLGTARVLALEPAIGPTGAVLVELPVMLVLAWFCCGFIIRRSRIFPSGRDRAPMGLTALVLLLLAEAGLSFVFGRSLAEHVALYRKADAQLGLLAQLGFAAFPLLRRRAGGPG